MAAVSGAARRMLFGLASAGSAVATTVHAIALFLPAFDVVGYAPLYPAWRHVVFIVIDGSLVWLLLRRPAWLVWPFGVLTIQEFSGHGRDAWEAWHQQGRVDWISAVSVAGVSAILALLIADWNTRRTGDR
jgi:hypothetical protein